MRQFYIKHIIAWTLLWWWFLYHRIIPAKKYKSGCKCGVFIGCTGDNWFGWYKWRNWLITMSDFYSPASYEYGGYGWETHVTCWNCGRQHHFSDSSV